MSSSSSSNPSGVGRAPPMHWCHECGIEMRPLLTPNPTCPRCNGGFVEEIDATGARPGMNEEDDDDDDDEDEEQAGLPVPFGRPFAGDEGRRAGNQPEAPLDFGSLMGGLLRGLATAGSQPRAPEQRPASASASSLGSGAGTENRTNNGASFRSGSSNLGGVNFSWGVGSYQHTTGQAGGSSSNTESPFAARPPVGLHEFVRRSFQSGDQPSDDGMGGAGAAADGRFFNHDNTNHHPEQRYNHFDEDQGGNNNNNGYPPELASLRDLFTNLFGGMGEGGPASMLVDLFGGGAGRTGDYVFNQQGLDDVITQLMEQTRGSTAPPPASDEAIERLQRFSRHDKAKVKQARNRECSTCMDDFLEEDEDTVGGKVEPGLDSNRLSSTIPGAAPGAMDTAEDPPEVIPGEEQQDELMLMPCNHLFHLDCLLPWLKTNGTCPVCRVSLEPDKQKGAASSSQSNDNRNDSAEGSSSSRPIVLDDDEEEDESAEAIRARSRRAAEARMSGAADGGRDGGRHQSIPGSFLQPDELD